MGLLKARRLLLKRNSRIKGEYTLRGVATALNMGYGNLCDIENEKQYPTVKTFAKLAEYYQLTTSDVRDYFKKLAEEE